MKTKSIQVISVFFFLLSMNLPAQTTFKVGLSVWTGYPESVRGFKQALKEAGLIESKNLTYFYGKSGIDKNKQRKIIQNFRKQKMDLIYSLTTPGTIIAKKLMPNTTPIVFSIVTYPADAGLIESFEYSANNLVGTSNFVPYKNYVHLIKKLVPQAKTAAIFHRKGEPNSKIQSSNLIRLLKRAGIRPIDREPTNVQEVRDMAQKLVGQADLFITTTDTLMQSGGESALIEISLKHNIPICSSNKSGIEQGSTFGPTADFYTLGKMSGEIAAQILLNNVKPSSLESKLQQPPLTLINAKSIKRLGLKVPKSLNSIVYVDKVR